MIQRILDFLKSIFSSFSKTSSSQQEHEGLPEIEVEEPQDASEMSSSEQNAVEVYDEEEIQGEENYDVLLEETDPPVTPPTPAEPEIILPEPTLPDSTTTQIPDPVIPDPVIPDPVVVDDIEIPVPEPTPTGTTGTPFPTPEPAPGTATGATTSEPTSPPTPTPTPTPVEPVPTTQSQHIARYMWCLDNGHGSKTKGKRSPVFPDGRQLKEYEFNRDIVKRMMVKLDAIGVQYYNVVPEVDVDNFLEGRVYRANIYKSNLPKLFLSIHSNAAPAPYGQWSAPSISGVETWFFKGNAQGKLIAAIFQKHIVAATGWKNRHIKTQSGRQFYVLRHTGMTAVLTENGFYNNQAQCLELLNPAVREKIAQAHVDAIMEIENSVV